MNKKKVAVWDTYVKRQNGNVMHFDILTDSDNLNTAAIFEYGKAYITAKGEPEGIIDSEHCQFCHVEEVTSEIKKAINQQGYYILELEEIPKDLASSPTKRQLVFHLKGHYKEHRFKNFSFVSVEEIQNLLNLAEQEA
ncbi:MAG: DUF2024 family protein [Cyclobacteriaceae bacterium]